MFDEKTKQLIAKYAMQNLTLAELEYVGLSYRLISMLETNANMLYLKQLLQYTQKDLLKIHQFGKTQLQEIFKALGNLEHLEANKKKWETSTSDKMKVYQLRKIQPVECL